MGKKLKIKIVGYIEVDMDYIDLMMDEEPDEITMADIHEYIEENSLGNESIIEWFGIPIKVEVSFEGKKRDYFS